MKIRRKLANMHWYSVSGMSLIFFMIGGCLPWLFGDRHDFAGAFMTALVCGFIGFCYALYLNIREYRRTDDFGYRPEDYP